MNGDLYNIKCLLVGGSNQPFYKIRAIDKPVIENNIVRFHDIKGAEVYLNFNNIISITIDKITQTN